MCNRCYKEKLNSMYSEARKRPLTIVPALDPMSGLNEYSNWVRQFMQRFGIGKYLSVSKWGSSRRAAIRKQLGQVVQQKVEQGDRRPTSALSLYDDIRDMKGADSYSPGEIAVAARTEARRMSEVFRLLQLQEAGAKYVRYSTRGDAKVRDGHSKFNGRIFEIDWLLRQENDEWRIPMTNDAVGGSYNCRCSYKLFIGDPGRNVNNVS